MIKRIFRLIPHPSMIWHGQRSLTVFDIFPRLTQTSIDSFNAVLDSCPSLLEDYDIKVNTLAAYAHPKTGCWPDDDDSILEVVPLSLPYIKAVSCYIDGTLRFSCDCNEASRFRLFSAEEFHIAKGQSVHSYLTSMLPLSIQAAQHVLDIMNTTTVTQVDVTYADANHCIGNKRISYWTPLQLDYFFRRNHLTCLEQTTVQTAPESK
jgi:hypothetical protein